MRELLILYFFAGILHCIAAASNCLDLSGDPTFNDVKNCKEIKGKGYVTVKIGQVDENEWSSFSMNLEQLQYVNMRIENSSVKTVYFLRLQSARQCSWFIENNPSLEEIEINARGPAATSYLQLYFSNNPSLTSVKFETNGQADFKIDGLAVVFEYNMALKTITLPDNSVKSLDELKIEGNPLLSKASLQYFKNLNTGTISNYVQDEGECVFAEEISDLGKLTPCKYVKGDLNLAKDVTGSAGSALLSQVNGSVNVKNPQLDQLGFLIGTNVTGQTNCQFDKEVANLDIFKICKVVKGDLTLAPGVKGSAGPSLLTRIEGNLNLTDAKEEQLGFLKRTDVIGKITSWCLNSLHGKNIFKDGTCPTDSTTRDPHADPLDSSKSNSTLTKKGNEGAGFFTQNLVPISIGIAVATLLILLGIGLFVYCRFFKRKKKKKAPLVVQVVKAPVVKKLDIYKKPTKKVKIIPPEPIVVAPLELYELEDMCRYLPMMNERQLGRLEKLVDEILTFNPLEFMDVVGPLKYTYYLPNGKDTRGKPMKKEYDDLLAKYRGWQPKIPVIPVPEPDYDYARNLEPEGKDKKFIRWRDERQQFYDTILNQKGERKIALCLWSHDDLFSVCPTLQPFFLVERGNERDNHVPKDQKLDEERVHREGEVKDKHMEKEFDEMVRRWKKLVGLQLQLERLEREPAGAGETSKATTMTKSTETTAAATASGEKESATTGTSGGKASATAGATTGASGEKESATTATVSGEKTSTEPTKPPEPKKPAGPKPVEENRFRVDQGIVYMTYFGKKYEPVTDNPSPRHINDEGTVTVYPFHLIKGEEKKGLPPLPYNEKWVTPEEIIPHHTWTFEQMSFVVAAAWPMRALGQDESLTFRAIGWAYKQMQEREALYWDKTKIKPERKEAPAHQVYILTDEEEHKEECALIAQLLYDSIMEPSRVPRITFLGACRLITARKRKSWDNPNMLLMLQRNLLFWAKQELEEFVEWPNSRLSNWEDIYNCMMLRSQATPATRVYEPDDLPCPGYLCPPQIVTLKASEVDDAFKELNTTVLLHNSNQSEMNYLLYSPMRRVAAKDERKWGIWKCESLGRAAPETLTMAGQLFAEARRGEPETELVEQAKWIDKPIGFKAAWGKKAVQDGGPDDDSTDPDDDDDPRMKKKNTGPDDYEREQHKRASEYILATSANGKWNKRFISQMPEEVKCTDNVNEREYRSLFKTKKYDGYEFKGYRRPTDMDYFAYSGPVVYSDFVRPLKRPVKRDFMEEGRFEDMKKMALKKCNSKEQAEERKRKYEKFLKDWNKEKKEIERERELEKKEIERKRELEKKEREEKGNDEKKHQEETCREDEK